MINKIKIQNQLRKEERNKYNKYYFQNEYWKEDLPGKVGNNYLSYDDYTHKKRFTFLTSLLKKYFKFEIFVDAGCGIGILSGILEGDKINCFSFDVSKDAFQVNNIYRSDKIVVASLEKIPFKSNIADLVFCSDVLEHIPFFDIESSIFELVRISKKYIVLTVNFDNPYKYHPTILSRETWVTLLLSTGQLKNDKETELKINKECKKHYPEYDLFVFEKIELNRIEDDND